jgi:hypothetical protein
LAAGPITSTARRSSLGLGGRGAWLRTGSVPEIRAQKHRDPAALEPLPEMDVGLLDAEGDPIDCRRRTTGSVPVSPIRLIGAQLNRAREAEIKSISRKKSR